MDTVTAPVLATNCYLLGADDASGCVVVDPGIGAADDLIAAIGRHGRRLEAILITHGHVDHTFSAGHLQREFGAPVFVHADDRYRLDDPFGTLGPQLAPMLEPLRDTWVPAEEITTVTDGDRIEQAGLSFLVLAMPGHTEGSVFYAVDDPAERQGRAVFTGDVLFAGTIGRTDLLGGDDAVMRSTLGVVADRNHSALTDAATVYPGHGPASTFDAERSSNPFLRVPTAGGPR